MNGTEILGDSILNESYNFNKRVGKIIGNNFDSTTIAAFRKAKQASQLIKELGNYLVESGKKKEQYQALIKVLQYRQGKIE